DASGEPQGNRGGDRARELSESARDRRRTGADGHLCRRARPGAPRSRAHRFRAVPVGIVRCLDHDSDEALGADLGRRRLRADRAAGLSRNRCRASDEGGRPRAAADDVEGVLGDGKAFRPGRAGRLRRILCDQADVAMSRAEKLRPLVLSVAVLAMLLLFWHAATRPTGGAVDLDPEYAALIGAQVTQGTSAMPGPGDVAAMLWFHLEDPFYDAGPNDKGIGLQ